MYEKCIVGIGSSQSTLFSLTNLAMKLKMNLLINFGYPIGGKFNMLQ
jgi:hypothetical protein